MSDPDDHHDRDDRNQDEPGDVDHGVPDTDPRHIDPAGDLADLVESGDLKLTLDDEQDVDELREFVEQAEAGEFGPADPALEATVRIARALLEDLDDE